MQRPDAAFPGQHTWPQCQLRKGELNHFAKVQQLVHDLEREQGIEAGQCECAAVFGILAVRLVRRPCGVAWQCWRHSLLAVATLIGTWHSP